VNAAALLLGAALLFASGAQAQVQAQAQVAEQTPGRMPTVQAESLAEVKITLPQGLPAERCLVFMGFEFEHQKVMDEWVEKLQLRRDHKPWVQLHLIGRVWGLISGFVNDRKRPYFSEAYQRERVIPVYTGVSAFITSMGFADTPRNVLVAVVQRDGTVLARAEGPYDAARAQALLALLAE
jgi:hypothetical protein